VTAVASTSTPTGIRRPRWTAAEDAFLRREWGELCWRELRRQLHRVLLATLPAGVAPKTVPRRSRLAICGRVATLGLELGIPQGFVSVSSAAETLGYHHRQFLALLRRQGVRVRPHWTAAPSHYRQKTDRRPSPWCLVDLDEAREAVLRDLAEQAQTETVLGAARRRDVPHVWLWRRLRAAGLLPEGRRRGSGVRLPSATIDAVIAAPPIDRRRRRAEAA
jgi:hypothetical protein